ncbi:WG repeat-containing protein [Chryseobacterium oryctis]|uniref:WG repeat-containing protein n=1 Tax=Chryseobacterium oryctis TaxID=2952618 RepID=A0ABT3HLN4_9FLAO|nr:WG repeat-containing protein [Chryseobacterium oryctis]MCW3160691.1 WG repeat-containing protein [Chryseobacterium oryctis]
MKTLVFVLFSSVCAAQQTDQYTQILLSKKLNKEVSSYSKGYGIIVDSEKGFSGIIDSLGTVTFNYPFKSEILHLHKNRFILKLKDGKTALIDEKGEQLISLENQKFNTNFQIKKRLISSKEGKQSLYDYNGKQIIPFSDKIEFAGENRFFVKKDSKWFIYNVEGQQVSDKEFSNNLYFYKGKAFLDSGDKKGQVIDNDGKILTTISKYSIDDIGAYPFLVTKNGKNKYGLIDNEENLIADEVYDQIFLGNRYIYLIKNEKVSVFSKAEKKLYPTDYSYVKALFKDLFSTQKNFKSPKMAIVRLDGEVVIPKEFDDIEGVKISGQDFIYLKKGKEQKLLDKDLNDILDDAYQIEKIFPNSLILSKNKAFYVFSVLDKTYKELTNISEIKQNGVFYYPTSIFPAMVCKNKENLYGIIDEKGDELVPFVYDDISTFISANEIIVKKGNKYGVINYQNEPLKEVVYDKYSIDRKWIKLTKDKEPEFLYFTDSEDLKTIE